MHICCFSYTNSAIDAHNCIFIWNLVMHKITLPTQQIGDFSITAISDGYISASLDLLSNINQMDAISLQKSAGVNDPSSIHINTYLIRGRDRTILIDTGAGGYKKWGGHLRTNLALAGVTPEDIDTILLTHAHPDHIGGLVDTFGEATFPRAELVIHEHELSFWENDNNMIRASKRAQGNFLFAKNVFAKYKERIRTFIKNDILPGISSVHLPGHTPGHCGYRIECGNTSLLIWGDIVHFPFIQIVHPKVSIAFDQDPILAAQTRTELLDIVSTDKLLVAGMHLNDLGFACIEHSGTSYKISYKV